MKQHITRILVLLLLAACNVSAIDLGKLKGVWTGQRKELENGVGEYSKVRITARPKTDRLVLLEEGRLPGFGKYVWRHEFREDGKYTAIAKSSKGLIFATSSGTWKKRRGAIKISGTNTNFSGSAAFSGSLEWRKRGEKLRYAGNSGTLRVVIRGRKK